MIKSLSINPELVIEEGERHTILLSIADSLLFKHLNLKNGKEDENSKLTQKLKVFSLKSILKCVNLFHYPKKR